MALVRITDPNELRPAHVVLLVVIVAALAGCCLLTSAGKPEFLPAGAVEWNPDSVLLAIVEILNLNYAQPTPLGVAVKTLVHGVAAAVALLVVAIGLAAWARAEAQAGATDTVIDVERYTTGAEQPPAPLVRRQLDPTRTAQALMLAFLVWALASSLWSNAPEYSHAAAMLLLMQAAWAFALGFGLNRRAAGYVAYASVAVLAVTALLAVTYHAQRNPTLRASYPIGNPLFLATCLMPGILIGLTVTAGGVRDLVHRRVPRGAAKIVLCLIAVALMAYATQLTSSRGPAIGLGIGVALLIFFPLPRLARRIFAGVVLAMLALLGAYFFSQRFADSPTGRSDSMRVRFYSWSYALDLFQKEPVTGFGQGGYGLSADVLAQADVESDPAALENRIADAHNEWLEVAADLGVVGVVLVLAALVLTVVGAVRALPQIRAPALRMITIALIASLAAIVCAECFGVALRREGTPLIYYTVIGLLWALSKPVPTGVLVLLKRTAAARVLCVVVGVLACVGFADQARRDFAAARAAYDVDTALKTGDLESAEQLAIRAFADRLPTQRKLVAHRGLAVSRLLIAATLQQRYHRRLDLADQSEGYDARMYAEAQRARDACLEQIELGETAIADLLAIAPTLFDIGPLVHNFKQLRNDFARVDGDQDAFARNQAAAAYALRNEITRRPFDANLATRYVAVDLNNLKLAEALTLLARPLRMQRPTSTEYDFINQFAGDPNVAGQVFTMVDALAAQTAAGQALASDPDTWPDRWTPELLRFGAIVAFVQSDIARAAGYLSAALPYYDILGKSAPLARAACHAELADARFFADPAQAQSAIESAEEAVKLAPKSQNGRLLCAQLARRLIGFHLAAGQEDNARKIIEKWTSGITADNIDREIASAYIEMAYGVLDQALATMPDKLDAWIARARELAPDAVTPLALACEVAIRRSDEARTVAAAREILKLEVDLASVKALLEHARTAFPDSAELQAMLEETNARLMEADEPPAYDQTPAPMPAHDLAVPTNGL